jgi:hypothetical protein
MIAHIAQLGERCFEAAKVTRSIRVGGILYIFTFFWLPILLAFVLFVFWPLLKTAHPTYRF